MCTRPLLGGEGTGLEQRLFLETYYFVEMLRGTSGRVHCILQLSRTRPSTDSCRRGTDAVAMIQTLVCSPSECWYHSG